MPFISPVWKAIRASGLLLSDMWTRNPIVTRITANTNKPADD